MEYIPIFTVTISYPHYQAIVNKHFNELNNRNQFVMMPQGNLRERQYEEIDIPGYFLVPINIMSSIYNLNKFNDECINVRCNDIRIQSVINAINYLFKNKALERQYKYKCIQLISDDERAVNPLKIIVTRYDISEESYVNDFAMIEFNNVILIYNQFTVENGILIVN